MSLIVNSHFFFLSKTNMIDFQFFHWVVELYEYLLPPHFLTYAFTSASEVQLLPVVISVSSHFWLSFISRTSSIATRLLPFMVLKFRPVLNFQQPYIQPPFGHLP